MWVLLYFQVVRDVCGVVGWRGKGCRGELGGGSLGSRCRAVFV